MGPPDICWFIKHPKNSSCSIIHYSYLYIYMCFFEYIRIIILDIIGVINPRSYLGAPLCRDEIKIQTNV